MSDEKPVRLPGQINTNTGIGLGLLVILVSGTIGMISAIYGTKTDLIRQIDANAIRISNTNDALATKIETVQRELNVKIESNAGRITVLESKKKEDETWNWVDMFKWVVELQRLNAGKINVPEVKEHK